jgi:penicillin-binding protein 2
VADPSGKITQTISPTVKNKVPVSAEVLDYIRSSLTFAQGHTVSGALAFDGSPIKSIVGGKTGTAEVYGKQDTSWLASWGPTYNDHGATRARFVVVGMLEQAGVGAMSAGPMLKKVWEGLLGGSGSKAIYPDSRPLAELPTVTSQSTNR